MTETTENNTTEQELRLQELLETRYKSDEAVKDYYYTLGCALGEGQHEHSVQCFNADTFRLNLPNSEIKVANEIAKEVHGSLRYNYSHKRWEKLTDTWEELAGDYNIYNVLTRYIDFYERMFDNHVLPHLDNERQNLFDLIDDAKDSEKAKAKHTTALEKHEARFKALVKFRYSLGNGGTLRSILDLTKGHELLRASEDEYEVPDFSDFFTIDDIENMVTSKTLVQGMLPGQGFGELVGTTTVGKTFLAHDLAKTIAAGLPFWMGQKTAAHEVHSKSGMNVPRNVLYITGEGNESYKRISKGWNSSHSKDEVDTVRTHFRDYLNHGTNPRTGKTLKPFTLMPDADGTKFITIDGMRESLKKQGFKPDLVIIDTLATVIGGTDENSASAMNPVVDKLREWSYQDDCFILYVHHTGKDETKKGRGTIALRSACDSSWMVTMDNETNTRSIEVVKLKTGEGVTENPHYTIENLPSSGLPHVKAIGSIAANVISADAKRTWTRNMLLNLVRNDEGKSKSHYIATYTKTKGKDEGVSKNPAGEILDELIDNGTLRIETGAHNTKHVYLAKSE